MDKILSILIKFGLNDDAAKQAANELQKLTEGTKDAAKETEQATVKTHEWKTALKLLGHEFGPIGTMARLVLNPWTAALAAIVIGIRFVKTEVFGWLSVMDDLDASSATGFGKILDSIRDVDRETAGSHDKFAALQKAISTNADFAVSAINNEKTALLQLQKASEEFELSQAKSDQEKDAIRARYATQTQTIKEQAAQKILGAGESQVARLVEVLAGKTIGLRDIAGGRTPDQISVQLKDLPKQIAELTAKIETVRADAEANKPNIFGMLMRGVFAGGSPIEEIKASRSRFDTVGAMEGLLKELQIQLTKMTQANALVTELQSLKSQISDLNQKIGQQRATFGLENATGRAVDARNAARPNQLLQQLQGNLDAALSKGDIKGMDEALRNLRDYPKQIQTLVDTINETSRDAKTALSRVRTINN